MLIGERFSSLTKRGCPTCAGTAPKSCARCEGKVRMCDWVRTATGWAIIPNRARKDDHG